MLTAIISVFTLLIMNMQKQTNLLNQTIQEKDAQIISLHEKTEANVVLITAAITECIVQSKSMSEGFKEISANVDRSTAALEKLARSVKK